MIISFLNNTYNTISKTIYNNKNIIIAALQRYSINIDKKIVQ